MHALVALLLCLSCCRLLPQWVAAGDHPASCQALLPQLPAANAGTLKLLMQVSTRKGLRMGTSSNEIGWCITLWCPARSPT